MILWTSSTGERAKIILKEHALERLFARFLYREDYDYGLPKNIDDVGGDMIIDDHPAQIAAVEAMDRHGLLITPYRGGPDPNPGELDYLYKEICRIAQPAWRRWFGL